MTARYHPKTLAKTLSYIACHAPAEFGLFWDPDGTMPWKEFYWVLQEDPSLRFVRESIIRELTGLGVALPFVIEGSRIRLSTDAEKPSYPVAENLPGRLYFACRRKQCAYAREHGLTPSSRSLVPLAATQELALRLGRHRDPEPLLVEVLAAKAQADGEPFYQAGAALFLVASLATRYLVLPLLRAEQQIALSSRKKAAPKPSSAGHPTSAGSFLVDVHVFDDGSTKDGGNKTGRHKGKKKRDWKQDAKKERHKRSL